MRRPLAPQTACAAAGSSSPDRLLREELFHTHTHTLRLRLRLSKIIGFSPFPDLGGGMARYSLVEPAVGHLPLGTFAPSLVRAGCHLGGGVEEGVQPCSSHTDRIVGRAEPAHGPACGLPNTFVEDSSPVVLKPQRALEPREQGLHVPLIRQCRKGAARFAPTEQPERAHDSLFRIRREHAPRERKGVGESALADEPERRVAVGSSLAVLL
eukprot:scaffold17221_cov90-Isochrysis_galbana.AAC.2